MASGRDVGNTRKDINISKQRHYHTKCIECLETLKDDGLMVWTELFGETSNYFLSLSLDLC